MISCVITIFQKDTQKIAGSGIILLDSHFSILGSLRLDKLGVLEKGEKGPGWSQEKTYFLRVLCDF